MHLSVAQSRPEPLLRFIDAVKLGTLKGPYRQKSAKHAQVYIWSVTGNRAAFKVLLALWPYLTKPKKEQARFIWKRVQEAKLQMDLPELPEIGDEPVFDLTRFANHRPRRSAEELLLNIGIRSGDSTDS